MSLTTAPFDRSHDFLLVRKYSSILIPFLTLNNIVTLKCGLELTRVIQNGTIRKLECGFLFAFHSNYFSILHQFRERPMLVANRDFCHTPPCIRRSCQGVPIGILPSRLVWTCLEIRNPNPCLKIRKSVLEILTMFHHCRDTRASVITHHFVISSLVRS